MFGGGFISDMVAKSKQNLALRRKNSAFGRQNLADDKNSKFERSKELSDSYNKFHSKFRSRKDNQQKTFIIGVIIVIILWLLYLYSNV